MLRKLTSTKQANASRDWKPCSLVKMSHGVREACCLRQSRCLTWWCRHQNSAKRQHLAFNYGQSSILRNVDTHSHHTRRRQSPEGTAARRSNHKIMFTIRRPTGRAGVRLHSFSSSAPDGGVWSSSRPIWSTPEKWPLYPQNKGLDGPQVKSGRLGKENMCWPSQDTNPFHTEL